MLIMNREYDTPSEDKSPSPELLSLIKAAANDLISFGELWKSIKKKGHDEGFTERELQDILRPLLKPQLNKDQIYYLFNTDDKKGQSKQTYQKLRNIPMNVVKKEPEQISNSDSEEEEEQPTPVEEEEEEEPTELELLKIENMQLKDALKKVQQFQPAGGGGQVQTFPPLQDDEVFEYLRKRENRINIFYYDNYGIDLITSRLIAQLKNSGVKTFKRLYFEV